MKKFVIDQIVLLMIGIAILILIPVICGPVFTLILEIVCALCWGYLCRRVLVLPFDLVLGKVSKTVYYASQCGVEALEFFKEAKCYIWKFYWEKDKTLSLLVPITPAIEKNNKICLPKADTKLRITYYRLSNILLCWESCQE